ncbi:MAG: hypothetical protein KAJ48_08145 [Elusimicrobiales bacterium]|nr:hypothetical protein [Elusimicrobiales bacterium]
MLVKLYELSEYTDLVKDLNNGQIQIKRALAPEKYIILDWIENNFSKAAPGAVFRRYRFGGHI